MPQIIQYGLVIESLLNIFGASAFILFPHWCLSHVIQPPLGLSSLSGVSSVPDSAAILFQAYGLLVISLTFPLLACIPDSPSVGKSRALIFKTLGLGEIFLIGLLLLKAVDANQSGFTRKGLVLAAANLVPALSWRVWTLYIRPEWLNAVGESKKKKQY